MKIYRILENFYLGDILDFPDEEPGIPYGYTRKAPPENTDPDNLPHTKWNGLEWEHTSAPPPAIPEPPQVISKLEFLNRLGDDGYIALLTAAKTDVEVEAWINKFNLISNIDLNDAKTKEWVSKFVSKNLITQEKADGILGDPLQPSE